MNLAEKPVMPQCLSQFSHIKRYVDRGEPADAVAKILPGEYYVTYHNEMITTVLGSCISVCIYDPKMAIGGMNHFMLPAGSANGGWEKTSVNSNTRYGNFAMEKLINDILANGGRRNRLRFKIFGGGNVMPGSSNVGERNIQFVKAFLTDEGYRWESEDVGADCPRKVNFYPMTGKVRLKRMPRGDCADVVRQEAQLQTAPEPVPQDSGDLELF